MVDWRALFDELRIPWRDRGSNCSRGHINIRCCWCRDDPSHHLTISELNGAYYCYRDPLIHSGRSLPWLLRGLGCTPNQIDVLVARYSSSARPAHSLTAEPASPVSFRWDRLEPAAGEPHALDYLRGRGYPDPARLCRDYGLRFTRTGRFAWRIMFPLSAGGETIGASGRAVRESMDPRYLTVDPYGGCLYIPHRARHTRTLLLIEGPFDALTIAAAVPPEEVTPAAILGVAVPPERMLTISELARTASQTIYVQDNDQPASAAYRLISELRGIPVESMKTLRRAEPPAGYKDIGELASRTRELRQWLTSICQSGGESSRTSRGPTPRATTGESGIL